MNGPLTLNVDLKSADPTVVSNNVLGLVFDKLAVLDERNSTQIKPQVTKILASHSALPSRNQQYGIRAFATLQEEEQAAAANTLHDVTLLQSVAHNLALRNQLHLSSQEKPQADTRISPRTPYGALQHWWTTSGITKAQRAGTQLKKMMQAVWEPIITAHPTESKNPAKVLALNDLVEALADGTDAEHIDKTLTSFLQINADFEGTKSVRAEIIEASIPLKNIISNVPAIIRDVERAVRGLASNLNFQALRPTVMRNKHVVPHCWVGGDRDGNANVTTEDTLFAADYNTGLAFEQLNEMLGALVENLRSQDISANLADDVEAIQQRLQARDYTSPNELHNALTEILNTRAMNDSTQRVMLEDILSTLNTTGFHFAKLHIRQDAGVLSRVVAAMFAQEIYKGKPFADLNDDDKTGLIVKSLSDKSFIKQRLQAVITELTAADDPVAADTARLFTVLKTRPDAWNQLIIASCGEGLSGDQSGPCRHVIENLALLMAGDADGILNIVQLFESKDSLKSARGTLRKLLSIPEFCSFIKKHGNIVRVMIALSDTTKLHGPGIVVYQEEALVECGLELLHANRGQPKRHWLSLAPFWGGAMDDTRGGGDPGERAYKLAHKLRARALEAGFTDREINAVIAPIITQTRQGRDVMSRLFGSMRTTRLHLREMVGVTMNFMRFMAAQPQDAAYDARLIAESNADDRFKRVCDNSIMRYETMHKYIMDRLGEDLSIGPLVTALNISSRASARNKLTSFVLTKLRAIQLQAALKISGLNLNAWFGMRALDHENFIDRQQLMQDARLCRELSFRTLLGCARTDFSAVRQFLRLPQSEAVANTILTPQHIKLFDAAFNVAVQDTTPFSITETVAAVRHSIPVETNLNQRQLENLFLVNWLEFEHRHTVGVCAETLYSNAPDAAENRAAVRNMPASAALRPFGRFSVELENMEYIVRRNRALLAEKFTSVADWNDLTAVAQKTCIRLARAVFDGTANLHTAISPGFGNHEYRLHELLSKLAKGGLKAAFRFTQGIAKPNGVLQQSHVWQNLTGPGF